MNRVAKQFVTAEQVSGIKDVTGDELANELQVEFGKFLLLTGTQILSVDGVSPAAIFEKYFQTKPPFNDTNKKVEFPDAFASAALQAWCESSPIKKLYVVSGDKDWQRLSEEITSFIHIKQLGELLEQFADSEVVADLKEAIRRERDQVLEHVTQYVRDVYFYVDDSVSEGEVTDVENVDVEIEDVYVVEVKNGSADLTVTCKVDVTLYVTAEDPDSVYRDSDDGELHSVWSASGSVEREIELDVGVTVSFDVKNPKVVTIESYSLPDEGISVSIEPDELSRDDDDEEPEIYGPDD